jgi:aspartate/methionine/tyrosine aminotransferase
LPSHWQLGQSALQAHIEALCAGFFLLAAVGCNAHFDTSESNPMRTVKVSSSVENLRYSVIREMGQMAQGMDDAILLTIGEPDLDTPAPIVARAFSDALNGHTHYTPNQGDPELIAALSRSMSQEMGASVTPSSIVITTGAMGALLAAFRTLLDPDDEVIVLEPYYPDYVGHIALSRGVIKPVNTTLEHGFIPLPEDIEAAIGSRTKIILLNSPNNPTGAIIPDDVLTAIAEIAIKHDLIVISDEVYDRISFAKKPRSIYAIPGMAERTVVIQSFSKAYAMTGWRVGFALGPERIIGQMIKVVTYSTACASSIGQRAALAALQLDEEWFARMNSIFRERIELVCDRLESIPGVRLVRPAGGFYVFVEVDMKGRGSRDFAIDLLKSKGLAVVPGYAFGLGCDGFVRIACTLPKERLAQAMDRLESYMTSRT